ncbi:MAG: NAD(P)H-dependent oxidoreductase [Pseudomonadota bacterium]
MSKTVLRIDASARAQGSVTRQLADEVIARIAPDTVITRDLSVGMPLLTDAWLGANWTPAEDRSDMQKQALEMSDVLIDELKAADTLVIAAPIYNFSVPAALKAWIDQIARAGITFKYTETGPVGLLDGKRAIIVLASGGTQVGSDIDFASGFLRHIMGFIGIHDVEFVAADQLMIDAEKSMADAQSAVAALAA